MFPAGETVTRLRAVLVEDRYGNLVPDWSDPGRLDIPDCAVAPRTSNEDTEQGRQGVVVGIAVYAPTGADITPQDRMEVRGEVWEVVGEVADWRSPYTGWRPGIVVNLARMEG